MLHFEKSGAASAPVLLLIHPMGADLSFWDDVRSIWSGSYNLIAMDLLGSGKSPAATNPVTIDDQVLAIEELVDKLGVDQLIPVGCAIGGTTAAAYAARNPERCRALVLSNPSLATTPAAREALGIRAKAVRANGIKAALPGAIDSSFHGDTDFARREAYGRRFAAQDPISYANIVEGMLGADVKMQAASIACPVLIISGDNDVLLPPAEHAVPLHAIIANSELRMVDGGAHFIPYQRPSEFAALVTDFLDRCPI